jgi:hypothetical protein
MTKTQQRILIGSIILLGVTLTLTFLRLGQLTIVKQMKEKISKTFGNGKLPVRIGYMGAGMILAAHWTLEPLLFIAGFSCVLVQVSYRKQWNLVALNINGLVAWIIHYIK